MQLGWATEGQANKRGNSATRGRDVGWHVRLPYALSSTCRSRVFCPPGACCYEKCELAPAKLARHLQERQASICLSIKEKL